MNNMYDELLILKLKMAGAKEETLDLAQSYIKGNTRVTDRGVEVIDQAGNPRIGNDAQYSNMTLDDFIDEFKASKPVLFEQTQKLAEATRPAERQMTMTERMIAEQAKLKADAAAKRSAWLRPETPNPFAQRTMNVTQQMIIMRHDPALAARLKAEARA